MKGSKDVQRAAQQKGKGPISAKFAKIMAIAGTSVRMVTLMT